MLLCGARCEPCPALDYQTGDRIMEIWTDFILYVFNHGGPYGYWII